MKAACRSVGRLAGVLYGGGSLPPGRIRELPYLLSHPEEGTARYGKDFKYVREGKACRRFCKP